MASSQRNLHIRFPIILYYFPPARVLFGTKSKLMRGLISTIFHGTGYGSLAGRRLTVWPSLGKQDQSRTEEELCFASTTACKWYLFVGEHNMKNQEIIYAHKNACLELIRYIFMYCDRNRGQIVLSLVLSYDGCYRQKAP